MRVHSFVANWKEVEKLLMQMEICIPVCSNRANLMGKESCKELMAIVIMENGKMVLDMDKVNLPTHLLQITQARGKMEKDMGLEFMNLKMEIGTKETWLRTRRKAMVNSFT